MFLDVLIEALWVVGIYMLGWFLLALIRRDNSVVDVAWGLGFVVLAVWSFLRFEQSDIASIVVSLLVLIWGIRLSSHIFVRNWGKAEDFRYKKWREEWGGESKWPSVYFLVRSFLQVFVLQGVLMLVIAMPILYVNWQGGDMNSFGWFGVGVWLVGAFFEVVGDWQLRKFVERKKAGDENKGAIMTEGLWRYTRHPNYFGEVVMWWGIFLVVLGAVDLGGAFLVVSPATITFLILFVSGVPMLEKKYEGNKEFEEYKERTNVFFPWFPRS